MNKLLGIVFIFIVFISCRNTGNEKKESFIKAESQEIKKEGYELSKPTENTKRVLVLFGGYMEKAEDIKREFKILEIAKKNGIAIIFMNFNQKLWLEENEKQKLAEQLQNIFIENELPTGNVYFGGFSSGGIVALLISEFATQQNLNLSPKGVFIVDSPVDLSGVYSYCKKSIDLNFSKVSVTEGRYLLNLLETYLGDPINDFQAFEDKSVFTLSTNSTSNISNLNNTKIRFYTEPDSIWWKKNRMIEYKKTNAYYIKRLSETLKKSGFNRIEYMPTNNKGYRANGERHPHSWSIVNKMELINWMTE